MASDKHWTLVIAVSCLIIIILLLRLKSPTTHLVLTKMENQIKLGTVSNDVKAVHIFITDTDTVQSDTQDTSHLQTQIPWSILSNINHNVTSKSVSNCKVGPLVLNASDHPIKFTLRSRDGLNILNAEMDINLDSQFSNVIQCSEDQRVMKMNHNDVVETTIKSYKYKGSDCVDVSKRAHKCVTEILTDCFELGTAHWYGGSELKKQLWPLEKVQVQMAPYLAHTFYYQPVQERFFFNSIGGGIYIQEDIPLFVSINASGDKQLCLQAKYDNYWYVSQNNTLPELNYTMCLAPDVRKIHQLMSERYIRKPIGTPNPDVFRYPIWSTWAQYKTRINQQLVLDFVDQIKKHNFSVSQLEIDDSWTPKYGDMTFNPKTFPDPKSMVNSMHSHNIAVTLWVHPFIDIDTDAFPLLAKNGWMMQDISGKSPALTSWWHGSLSGHLDFSNPDAVKWFSSELNVLKTEFGVDSFKFDAGDVNFLPPVFRAHQQFINKNYYTRLYATTAYESDLTERRLEVRTGARTQHLPVFVRILDRSSTWTLSAGLKSVITTGLCFGILGYPFLLPDYVGGNSYGAKPDPELFIRWVQANALMPVMQFSLLPWAGNNSTVLEVAQDMVKLHEKYADLFINLANQSVTTGYPIMRPLWWIAPTDEAALTVDDQFLVGDDLLVAPVVEQGETIRTLYLPAGRWLDELKGEVFEGGKWIDYPVTLKDLPFFSRMK